MKKRQQSKGCKQRKVTKHEVRKGRSRREKRREIDRFKSNATKLRGCLKDDEVDEDDDDNDDDEDGVDDDDKDDMTAITMV